MTIRKVRKGFWEELFVYPSFNIRFGFILVIVLFIFFFIGYLLLFYFSIATTLSDQVAIIGVIMQAAAIVLGIFAAYYALRQLVETRFIKLEEVGMQELKRNHYFRAFDKWREAFYIKPEASVFTNLCEVLLLIGDYEMFDNYIQMSQSARFLKKEIFEEVSNQLILLYLQATRQLLVKNQGAAEGYITALVELVRQEGLRVFDWDFMDLQTSTLYQNLNGECKNMSENLIAYLSQSITPNRKEEFEAGNFATQV